MNKIILPPAQGNENPSLEAALGYTQRGWRVVPVNSETKRPTDPDTGHEMGQWQHRATIDPAQVDAWWQHRPDLGVGIATGRGSGIVVIDIDIDVAKGKDGPSDRAKLEAAWGALPETLTQSTPSGGHQLFFRYPAGAEDVPNRVGFAHALAGHRRARFCGIDIRGDGGQVNAPPTARAAGAYRWHSDPLTTFLAELPARWVEGLSETARAEAIEPSPFDDPEAEPETRPRGKAESVMAACGAMDLLRTDPKGVTEWHWKMGLGIIGRCERGRSIAHKLSALDPARYNAADTDRALDYVLAKSGPHSCESFAKEVPDTCAACLVRSKIKTPAELGREDPELLKLMNTHVFATDAAKFYDFNRRVVKSEKDFSATFAHIPIKFPEKDKEGKWVLKPSGGRKLACS